MSHDLRRPSAAASLLLLLGLLPLVLSAGVSPSGAAQGPFDALLGSWGGRGTYRMDDGRTEKVRCEAYYTGGGTQLGMVVRCASTGNRIEIRSKLSASGRNVRGSWEERTYNAEGSASGQITGEKLTLTISGGISGAMTVTYSRSRQVVSIATEGIPLKSVNISLSPK